MKIYPVRPAELDTFVELPFELHCDDPPDDLAAALAAVSYTHLTLPTIYSV